MSFQITSTQLSALHLYNRFLKWVMPSEQGDEITGALTSQLSHNLPLLQSDNFPYNWKKNALKKKIKNTNLTRLCASWFWSKDHNSWNKSEQEHLKNSELQSKGQPLLFMLSWFPYICVYSTYSTFSLQPSGRASQEVF